MQLKFHNQSSIGQTIGRKLIKVLLVCLFLVFVVFLLDKVNFPSPKKNIKKDITNEIIKLK